jgi:transposase
VTVIIDLTPVRDKTGPARLLDMIDGRSKAGFKNWLAERPAAWRDGIEVVAMDGFTGFKTATAEEIPTAVTVMDPFHVVRVRHEVPCVPSGGERPPPPGCHSSLVKLRAA